MLPQTNLFRLDGQVAVVTGAGGHLGPHWVEALLSAGATVAALDLPGAARSSQKVHFYDANVTDQASLADAVTAIRTDLGHVSILVNNAGIDIPPSKSVAEKPSVRLWEVNVQGVVNCIEAFLPDMKQLKKGSIVTIGSLYAQRSPYHGLYEHLGFDKPWVYGSTKAAVGQLTRHFATRLAEFGIRVNMLSPGGVQGNQDSEFIKKYSHRVPMGRMADPENDLGGPLIFLASAASSYVTGIDLEVNGGYTAW